MVNPTLGNKLELLALHSVATLADGVSGSDIRRHVSSARGYDYSVGAIYTTLSRLEVKGFVTSESSAPLPVRGGRSRKLYKISGLGKRALDDAEALARGVWSNLGQGAIP